MTGPSTDTTVVPSGLDFRIGIDVGGTWIKGAIINMGSGTPVGGVRRLRTPACGTVDAVADTLNQLIDELGSQSLGRSAPAVGVAIPSIVQHGVARSVANMDDSWIGLDVQAYLRERLGRPVCVVNDADAAGMAEARYGIGKDKRGVVLVPQRPLPAGRARLVARPLQLRGLRPAALPAQGDACPSPGWSSAVRGPRPHRQFDVNEDPEIVKSLAFTKDLPAPPR